MARRGRDKEKTDRQTDRQSGSDRGGEWERERGVGKNEVVWEVLLQTLVKLMRHKATMCTAESSG